MRCRNEQSRRTVELKHAFQMNAKPNRCRGLVKKAPLKRRVIKNANHDEWEYGAGRLIPKTFDCSTHEIIGNTECPKMNATAEMRPPASITELENLFQSDRVNMVLPERRVMNTPITTAGNSERTKIPASCSTRIVITTSGKWGSGAKPAEDNVMKVQSQLKGSSIAMNKRDSRLPFGDFDSSLKIRDGDRCSMPQKYRAQLDLTRCEAEICSGKHRIFSAGAVKKQLWSEHKDAGASILRKQQSQRSRNDAETTRVLTHNETEYAAVNAEHSLWACSSFVKKKTVFDLADTDAAHSSIALDVK